MNREIPSLFVRDDFRLRAGWRFLFSIPVLYFAMFVAGTMAATVAGDHLAIEESIYRSLLMLLLLASFMALARVLDQPEGSVLTYLGLPRANWLRQTLTGALLGFGLIFLAVLITAVFFNYHITKIVLTPRTLVSPLLVGFMLLCGAMAEELMFRGYPFQRLVEGIGKVGAILVLSAWFGSVHLNNPHVGDSRAVHVFAFLNTLLIGIVFALAYLRTQALWLPWGLHFSWNFTMGLIFGLPVSGITTFSLLVKAKAQGPAWFLGGGYGFEGGLIGTMVSLLGLLYVVFFVRQVAAPPLSAQLDEAAPESIQPSGTA